MTPPETFALRPNSDEPNTPGWLVRAVPNKYPVLEAGAARLPGDPLDEGRGEPALFASGSASGAHEVIVHTPAHVASLIDLSEEQFALATEAWRIRMAAQGEPYVHLIVNEDPGAGASLEHSHAQLYALPFVPVIVARERERFTAHNTRTMGGCLLCDLLQEEVRRKERLVAVDEHAVLLAPYASRMPYELQLVPRRHEPSFIESDGHAERLLREGLERLKRTLGGVPPFNLWLRTAPAGAEHFHWRIDLVPRMTELAGLELGTGIAVNIYPPERAAEDLRGS